MVDLQNIRIRKELIDLLDELNIENFTLNTEEKKLIIHYKEDFDIFFPKLNVIPECFRDSEKILPYSATHYAFFEYNGWDIRGNIINNKANLSANIPEPIIVDKSQASKEYNLRETPFTPNSRLNH